MVEEQQHHKNDWWHPKINVTQSKCHPYVKCKFCYLSFHVSKLPHRFAVMPGTKRIFPESLLATHWHFLLKGAKITAISNIEWSFLSSMQVSKLVNKYPIINKLSNIQLTSFLTDMSWVKDTTVSYDRNVLLLKLMFVLYYIISYRRIGNIICCMYIKPACKQKNDCIHLRSFIYARIIRANHGTPYTMYACAKKILKLLVTENLQSRRGITEFFFTEFHFYLVE